MVFDNSSDAGFIKRTFRRTRYQTKSMQNGSRTTSFKVSKTEKQKRSLTVELDTDTFVIVSSSKNEKIKRDLEKKLSFQPPKQFLSSWSFHHSKHHTKDTANFFCESESVTKRTLKESTTKREYLCRSLSAELLAKLNEDRNNNYGDNMGNIDVKFLSPQYLPKKSNSLKKFKSAFSHKGLKRSRSEEICKQYALRHLNYQETKLVKGLIKKRNSVPELSVNDEDNAKVIITHHQVYPSYKNYPCCLT